MDDRHVDALVAEAAAAQTPAEKWAVIEKAWVLYCQRGAGQFDWDYESRQVMSELTDHFAFEGLAASS